MSSTSVSMTISDRFTEATSRPRSDSAIAVFWDIENCPVPSDVRPEDVSGNIRMALKLHPAVNGAVTTFCAYGDFNNFSRRLREGCQRTGVKLVDVPNGRKDAADKAILIDMFLFALDNPPPSFIWLISGDVDFAPALHILGQRGYTIILAIPSGVGVSSALTNAGMFMWDWLSIARGEGFVQNNLSSSLDFDGLKLQLVKLLEQTGGCLPLAQIPIEFQKLYGRSLCVPENGSFKLANLVKKMGDSIAVDVKGKRKYVYLKNWAFAPTAPPAISQKQKELEDEIEYWRLEQFRRELEEIMVSYSCGISLACFEEIYQLRYKTPLDYKSLGVEKLDDLFRKVSDVVLLHEDPYTKQKFVVAVDA